MTQNISRRGLFSLGLAAGATIALSQPAFARGGPDPEDRLTAKQKRERQKEIQAARRAKRAAIRAERQKIKR